MQIGEFNGNISGHLTTVFDTGEPTEIERRHKKFVTVAPTSLFNELLQVAGRSGQEVLTRYRKAPEQRKQEEAA